MGAVWEGYNNDAFDVLYDLFSIVCEESSYNYDQKDRATKFVQEYKSWLNNVIGNKKLTDDKIAKVMHLYDLLSVSPMFRCENSTNPYNQEKWDELDIHSQVFISTYLSLVNRFMSVADGMDFSAFTLYLAKTIENEYNLSLFQMVRAVCNIQMPKNYGLYDEGKGDVYIQTSHKSVNVNERKNKESKDRELKRLTLGDLYFTYKDIHRDDNEKKGFDYTQLTDIPKHIHEFLIQFKDYRNECGHGNLYTKEQYLKSKGLFDMFMNDFMPELAKIKNKFNHR